MTSNLLTAQELMDLWQLSFGTLDSKWHTHFIESPYVSKILEYPSDEVRKCVLKPMILVEYVGPYRIRTERPAKKLSEILDHLASERAKSNRAPLGTYSRRIDASGSEMPF
jgi:hypothetical protein